MEVEYSVSKISLFRLRIWYWISLRGGFNDRVRE